MRFFLSQNFVASSRRSCKMVLAVIWVLGLICGSFCAAGADNLSSLMRACCHAGVSIVGLFFVPFLPFLISAAAVYCSAPLILYLASLCKSFLLGFCVSAVWSAFSSGGPVMSLLLLFTDIFTAPALFVFQLRHINGGRLINRSVIFTLLWFAAVSAVDHLWILPLIRAII